VVHRDARGPDRADHAGRRGTTSRSARRPSAMMVPARPGPERRGKGRVRSLGFGWIAPRERRQQDKLASLVGTVRQLCNRRWHESSTSNDTRTHDADVRRPYIKAAARSAVSWPYPDHWDCARRVSGGLSIRGLRHRRPGHLGSHPDSVWVRERTLVPDCHQQRYSAVTSHS
jgi:hypothetical protein